MIMNRTLSFFLLIPILSLLPACSDDPDPAKTLDR